MDTNADRAAGTAPLKQSCQICGAALRGDEPLCDPCSRTADTIADTPLPPLPDGGLAHAMPTWLRSSQCVTAETALAPQAEAIDFARILSVEDIPLWLKRMAERHAAEQAPAAVSIELPASAHSQVQPTTDEVRVPIRAPAGLGESRVKVGAVPPRPIDPTPAPTQRSRPLRLPAVENRTAIGVSILAAIAAALLLAIILLG